MKTGRLLNITTASAVIAVAMATAALAAEGMAYGGSAAPAPSNNMPRAGMTGTPKSTDVRKEIASPLKEAVDLGKKKDIPGALAKVKEADAAATDKSPYEDYVISNFLVNFEIQANDHPAATAAANRALATNSVPEKDLQPLLKTALTLNAEAKNYKNAISAGEQLQQLNALDYASGTNLAIAYYNSGSFPNALKTAKAALALETANGGKPIEPTLAILKNSQIKTGDMEGARLTEIQLCDISTAEPKAQCDLARKAKPK